MTSLHSMSWSNIIPLNTWERTVGDVDQMQLSSVYLSKLLLVANCWFGERDDLESSWVCSIGSLGSNLLPYEMNMRIVERMEFFTCI